MRIRVRNESREMDMTPMIDIVFLLISFFTLAINFSNAEQSALIRLPKSELAIPPKIPPAEPLSLQVMESGRVLFKNEEYDVAELENPLNFQRRFYERMEIDLKTVSVLIRGDERCETGKILEIMEKCHDQHLEDISLKVIVKTNETVPSP